MEKKPQEKKPQEKKPLTENEKLQEHILKEELSRLNDVWDELCKGKPEIQANPKAAGFIKLYTLFRILSTMKVLKNDKEPVEIIDNLFIGSLGAASNKESLINNKITHIIVAAKSLRQFFPNDFKYVQFQLLDSETEEIEKYFDQAHEFINNAFKEGGKVLVHW